ncbi:uncharacterized protein EI90DRAFT_3128689 [Cantharellus anzutake]|uniref:uncharacterized protein n=1 Tax=Cantharellus anzutake TaxID=1750568 RepID=UPI001904E08D|nr:uncharacterized protein EI90DRAFT_3128689 [Cantharellus anzutake]KAF8325578.1 hypothetical protein EI90DRAFT_3128689 [Cantharellus anzutake]
MPLPAQTRQINVSPRPGLGTPLQTTDASDFQILDTPPTTTNRSGSQSPTQPSQAMEDHLDHLEQISWQPTLMGYGEQDSPHLCHQTRPGPPTHGQREAILHPHWPKSDSLLVCLQAHFPLILRGQRWFIQPSPNCVYAGSMALQPLLSASSPKHITL